MIRRCGNRCRGTLRIRLLVLAVGVLAIAGSPAPAQDDEPHFIRLGHFPDGLSASGANDISPEGSVVVGSAPHAGFGDFEAFRWTEQTGLVGLGRLVAWGISKARATSSDGEVVVGWSHSAQGPEAFRWTEQTGMVGLGDLPGGKFNSMAFGVSWDGRVIVGHGRSPDLEAYRWTPEEGMVGLGDLPGGSVWSAAIAVSADGSVIAGHSSSANGREAFRWTPEEGMVALDQSDDWSSTAVYGISADGRTVVGFGFFRGERSEAFRWTRATGFEGLGDLPGGRFQSTARATNANGSIVVGESITETGNQPFIWTKRHGLRNLRDLIVDGLGLDVEDMELKYASAVSADGRWITGGAWTDDGSEGWVVYLGPGCPADFDGDADTDAEDFFLYLDLFAAGDMRADIDDDGDIDQDDFFGYLDLFSAGC